MPDTDNPQPDGEHELVRRARSGEEEAFGALMRAHYERTFRLVYAIVRNEHDARDVCQEIWLAVWRELPQFRGDARFTTWLHPIATRRALDHLRKRHRWFDRFLPFGAATEAAFEPSAAADPRDADGTSERIERMRAVLASLPPSRC